MTNERREEIEKTLKALTQYWMSHPELRLGQIIYSMNFSVFGTGDSFYIPDSLLYSEIINKIKSDGENPEDLV